MPEAVDRGIADAPSRPEAVTGWREFSVAVGRATRRGGGMMASPSELYAASRSSKLFCSAGAGWLSDAASFAIVVGEASGS